MGLPLEAVAPSTLWGPGGHGRVGFGRGRKTEPPYQVRAPGLDNTTVRHV